MPAPIGHTQPFGSLPPMLDAPIGSVVFARLEALFVFPASWTSKG